MGARTPSAGMYAVSCAFAVSIVKLFTVSDLPFRRLANLSPPEWLISPAS